MPVRATKRGGQRTPFGHRADADVLICGASFAGLAVARELAGAGARVLVLDRYEIGERQTSACAAPTAWLWRMGLDGSIRQTFSELVIHTPVSTSRYGLPWTFSTFDYRELCALLAEQGDFEFETAKVDERRDDVVVTDRGELRAPLVVDALGWRRVLSSDGVYQPPDAPLSRGLEVHPHGESDELEIWIDRRYVPAGYGWSFPARAELAPLRRLVLPALPAHRVAGVRRCAARVSAPATTRRYFYVASAVYIAVASVWIAVGADTLWDYPVDAGPPIDALAHLRL